MGTGRSHAELAAELRTRVLESGIITSELRKGALAIGEGMEAAIPQPCDHLAHTIEEASYRVTDQQVTAVREAAGSDKGAFEVVMAASVGAGLRRWNAAVRAIGEATNATP